YRCCRTSRLRCSRHKSWSLSHSLLQFTVHFCCLLIAPRLEAAGPFELGDERRKFVGVSAPAAKPTRVDWLAHLGAAHGTHPAVALVEAGAIRIRRQVDVGE